MENLTQIREVNVIYGRKSEVGVSLNRASKVADFIRSILPNNSQEHLCALYLDSAHRAVAYSVVSTGLLTSCPVHPREVYQRAILVGAYSVIIAHNHPSDDCTPSNDDRQVTKQMAEAAKTLGLRLLDHVIVSDIGGYYSFQEAGEI